MSTISNQLQRIVNAKNLIGQKAANMGLSYDDGETGLHPLTLDEQGNPEQTIDIIATAIDEGIKISTVNEVAERDTSTIEVSDTGKINVEIAMAAGEVVKTPRQSYDPPESNGHGGGTIKLEQWLDTENPKTITPTREEQVAVASGKFTTGDVKVAPIPENFVDVSDTTKGSDDLVVTDAKVTVPSGYYPSGAEATVRTIDDVINEINPLTQSEITFEVKGWLNYVEVSVSPELEAALAAI